MITSVIWRTTSSLLRNLPSKRGARSRASIWKKEEGKIVILWADRTENGDGFGSGLALTAADSNRWLGRVSASSILVITGLGLDLAATRLNRRVLFISPLRVGPMKSILTTSPILVSFVSVFFYLTQNNLKFLFSFIKNLIYFFIILSLI